MCLAQFSCESDPSTIFVVDVYQLGPSTFSMQTTNGTSLKAILEDPNVRKVWFDPRNDIDALYHYFGVRPRGIFDLQIAEVAVRRRKGLKVSYVLGLSKCLESCPGLIKDQKQFAVRLNELGKKLFEPFHGGSYDVFKQRPMNHVILVYAAHDVRYMLALYENYRDALDLSWERRVEMCSAERGNWCLNLEYVIPSSEAPSF